MENEILFLGGSAGFPSLVMDEGSMTEESIGMFFVDVVLRFLRTLSSSARRSDGGRNGLSSSSGSGSGSGTFGVPMCEPSLDLSAGCTRLPPL